MRSSDGSSDVCSSDLMPVGRLLDRKGHALQYMARDLADDLAVIDDQTGFRHHVPPTPQGLRLGRERKSTRLNSATNAHLACRLLLEKKQSRRSSTQLRKAPYTSTTHTIANRQTTQPHSYRHTY